MFCPICGKEAEADANYCNKCGTKLRQEASVPSEEETTAGADPGESKEAAAATDVLEKDPPESHDAPEGAVPEDGEELPSECPVPFQEPPKKSGRISPKWIVLAACAVVLVIVLAVAASGPKVTEILFEESTLSVQVGEQGSVGYTIHPEEAEKAALRWRSSDPSVATVDKEGTVSGVTEGTCTITAEAKSGVSASIEVQVTPELSDFEEIFVSFLDSSYASVAADGSYLLIDTNPRDYDDYSDDDAVKGLYYAIVSLGLPDSLIQKMSSTRALDGRQSEEYDDLEVSWSYHPDKGLEVLFSLE